MLSFLHPLLGPSGWGGVHYGGLRAKAPRWTSCSGQNPKQPYWGQGPRPATPNPPGFLLLVPLSISLSPTVSLGTSMAALEQGQSWVLAVLLNCYSHEGWCLRSLLWEAKSWALPQPSSCC